MALCDHSRASSIRPLCAATIADGNSFVYETRPSCVRNATESAVCRSASSQFPARHSSRPRFQSAQASFAGSFWARRTATSSRLKSRAASRSNAHTSW